MENLNITGQKKKFHTEPHISFDGKTGICVMSGESYLEETISFYTPVYNWLRAYFRNPENTHLEFNFKLSYFNTSSSRCILSILYILKDQIKAGKDIKVKWYYDKNDDDMIEEIEDFILDTRIEIEMIEL